MSKYQTIINEKKFQMAAEATRLRTLNKVHPLAPKAQSKLVLSRRGNKAFLNKSTSSTSAKGSIVGNTTACI